MRPRLPRSLAVVLTGTVVILAAGTWAATVGPRPLGTLLAAAPAPNARGLALSKALCIVCHKLPAPDILPRSAWKREMQKMALFVEGKPAADWNGPALNVELSEQYKEILAYYEAAAPEALASPAPWPSPDGRPLRFVMHPIAYADALTPEPAIANVRLADLDGSGHPALLACDMRQGVVLRADPAHPEQSAVAIATLNHPDHVAVADVDGDGRLDLIVSDLGEFFPGDHERGAVTWLRARPDGGYTAFTLGGFPRVADAEPADFDGDGKLDFAVAGFGFHAKGEIDLLRSRTLDWAQPVFDRVKLDGRPGAIHVVPVDLDGDGKLDIVAVIAQEHEAVVFLKGDGKGNFAPAQTLYAAPHPNWGSSGMQIVDLDKDGDLDILLTNGDMFDDDIIKPYHGIQWLENKGGLRFEPHPLAALAGAHRAVAVDLDGDGDLDIVASAFTGVVSPQAAATLPSLVWLEQVSRGKFERHTIEVGQTVHATLDVGDVDGDGDIDIVTGVFRPQGTGDHWLEVWENQKVRPTSPAH
jgi:FG-GAP-like repeat